MKSWVRRATVLAAGLTLAGGMAAAPATSAEILAWECSAGFSCYYDGFNGITRIYVAPGPGCHNLPASAVNKISSVNNRGGGTVRLYDSNNCVTLLATVPVGPPRNLDNAASNRANSVRVDP
nr:peptidase inhibitor family I36 protein [Kibdelosporangium sp. MJ126-NF4]CEL13895.1 hypothetical protein [Kibdelosporangium sp. MJ126-NF4]CTQ88263.1 hypothetical protein [Kibdelosporangium sp. MJ126-NF4]